MVYGPQEGKEYYKEGGACPLCRRTFDSVSLNYMCNDIIPVLHELDSAAKRLLEEKRELEEKVMATEKVLYGLRASCPAAV